MFVGVNFIIRRCMKASDCPRGKGLSINRLNWQGDSRPNGQVSRLAAVSGAPVQKGFSAMNFRILATSVRPPGRVFALLAATALAASLLAPDGNAQTPAPAPAAPPPPNAHAKPNAAPKAA